MGLPIDNKSGRRASQHHSKVGILSMEQCSHNTHSEQRAPGVANILPVMDSIVLQRRPPAVSAINEDTLNQYAGLQPKWEAHSEHVDSSQYVLLGAVEEQNTLSSKPWAVTLQLRNKAVEFNIDTGAEVTVISEAVWKDIGQPLLLPSDRTLRGPDTHVLPAQGKFTGKLVTGTQEAEEEIYVVKGLNKPLLG